MQCKCQRTQRFELVALQCALRAVADLNQTCGRSITNGAQIREGADSVALDCARVGMRWQASSPILRNTRTPSFVCEHVAFSGEAYVSGRDGVPSYFERVSELSAGWQQCSWWEVASRYGGTHCPANLL